jgi:thiol-disulfide isomerase/thioredoxin
VARRPSRPLLSGRSARAWHALLTFWLVGAAPPAPLELETLEGAPVLLAPSPGRPLLVHFWATWCPSCAEELPALARASVACAGTLEVALVDVDEDAGEIRRFLAERGVALDSLRDPGGKVWRKRVGARGLPANLVFSADGESRSELGPRSPEQWRSLFAALGCEDTLLEP